MTDVAAVLLLYLKDGCLISSCIRHAHSEDATANSGHTARKPGLQSHGSYGAQDTSGR
ncbi:MAG: hypothetical protein QGH37_32095 [Candidatus Poribacteria bacterium]|nr:hypothetical protein [Candidatus Poribacteria bacterium]